MTAAGPGAPGGGGEPGPSHAGPLAGLRAAFAELMVARDAWIAGCADGATTERRHEADKRRIDAAWDRWRAKLAAVELRLVRCEGGG